MTDVTKSPDDVVGRDSAFFQKEVSI